MTNVAQKPGICDPLDPVENISPRVPAGGVVHRDFLPGRYREQYRVAARDGLWGWQDGTSCGSRCLARLKDGKLQLIPMLCDTWGCKLCGPRKAAWLIRQIKQAVERYELRYFWTLTVWTETCTQEESATLITAWWNKLLKRLKRRYGRFSFIWTLEFTKRGYAHLHLLTSCDVSQLQLSKDWSAISGGSKIVKVDPVSSDKAQTYITKYCSKQGRQRVEPGYEFLKGRRFFSKSQDIEFEPFRNGSDQAADSAGGELVDVSPWQMVDRPYWEQVRRLSERGGIRLQAAASAVPRSVWVGVELISGVPMVST